MAIGFQLLAVSCWLVAVFWQRFGQKMPKTRLRIEPLGHSSERLTPMKAKNEANRYDKIFKENIEAVTPALVEKVLRIQVAKAEKIQTDLPKTLERKPDQLLRITDTSGDTFLLHLEFQVVDDPNMVDRML
jgi:hypothetical protein